MIRGVEEQGNDSDVSSSLGDIRPDHPAGHCPRGRCLPIPPQPPWGPADRRDREPDDRDREEEIPLLFRESDEASGGSDGGGVWVALTAVGAALSGIAYQWKKSS